MTVRKPHFLLFCDASASHQAPASGASRSKWRCVVDDLSSNERIEMADNEANSTPERSALMAVVRGLEALEQPSQVTLVTSSPYVNKGLRYGLNEWRENDYHWEHFGTEKPIRNADLWRRIDQALQFHSLHCRLHDNSNTSAGEPFEDEYSNSQMNGPTLRIDAAHPEHIRVTQRRKTSLRMMLSCALTPIIKTVHASRIVLTHILCIPEQTIYAIESLVDGILGLNRYKMSLRNYLVNAFHQPVARRTSY